MADGNKVCGQRLNKSTVSKLKDINNVDCVAQEKTNMLSGFPKSKRNRKKME